MISTIYIQDRTQIDMYVGTYPALGHKCKVGGFHLMIVLHKNSENNFILFSV